MLLAVEVTSTPFPRRLLAPSALCHLHTLLWLQGRITLGDGVFGSSRATPWSLSLTMPEVRRGMVEGREQRLLGMACL